MEPSEYLGALRKHWLLILVLGVLGFGAGYGYSTTLPESYRATSSIYVTVPRGDSVGELVQGDTYIKNRIESYAQLASKPYVLDPVITQLGLDTTARSLAKSIVATSPLNTAVLEISAVSGDPQRAADIANAVSAQLAVAVESLEGEATDQPSVQITVVAQATPPTYAYSPNTKLNSATGLVLGLVIGAVIALARTLLDTRIRNVKDVRRATDAAVLSSVRYDRKNAKDPVVLRRDPFGDQAEAFRRLRTNLRFLNLSGSGRAIVVTSSLPTEGKTTTSMNLAVAMAEGSSRILLVDADLRRPSIARYLGLEGSVGLTTVLIGEATLDDVIQPWGEGGTLDILPAGQVPPNPSELLDSPAMAGVLHDLAKRYDIVLLDSAPLLPVTDAAILARITDGALVVVGCRTVHRHQLSDALGSLNAVGARVLGLVLNQVSAKATGSVYTYGSTPRATAKAWPRGRHGRLEPTRTRSEASAGAHTWTGPADAPAGDTVRVSAADDVASPAEETTATPVAEAAAPTTDVAQADAGTDVPVPVEEAAAPAIENAPAAKTNDLPAAERNGLPAETNALPGADELPAPPVRTSIHPLPQDIRQALPDDELEPLPPAGVTVPGPRAQEHDSPASHR